MRSVQEIASALVKQIMSEREQYDHASIGMIKGIQVLSEAIEKEFDIGQEGTDNHNDQASSRDHAEPGEGSSDSNIQKTIDAPGC